MIKVSHLTRMYGPRAAIQDLNFEIEKGEIVGFLGPNGAGKTTTMKILTGFMPPTSGTAEVGGYQVFSHPLRVKGMVGYLPETPPVYNDMRVRDYIEFAAKLHDVPKNQLNEAVRNALEKTGTEDVEQRLIGNLSKGYRQRVGLAQALVHNPEILILDEPTVGLDPKQIIEIRQLIQSLAGDHTVILSSHILPEVTATCERIIVINNGKIVAQDTIDRLTTRLEKGKLFTLTVQDPKQDGIQALESLPGVKRVTHSESQNDNQKLSVEIHPESGEIRDQIVKKAVEHEMGVLEFSAERVSLEEVFLELTTEEENTEDRTGVAS